MKFSSASGAGAAQAAIRTDNANTKTKQLLTTNVDNFFLFNLILLIKQNLNLRLFHTSSFIVSPPHISSKIRFILLLFFEKAGYHLPDSVSGYNGRGAVITFSLTLP